MKKKSKAELMEELRGIECDLSPENLACDGEASAAWVRQQGARLHKARANVIKQLGYEPSTTEIFPSLKA